MDEAEQLRRELEDARAELRREVDRREQAELERREAVERLAEAEALANFGNWWWDVRTGAVEWSAQVYRIFRLDPESFVPQIDSILALSPWPEDHARDQELIQKAIESRQPGSYEQRFLRPDQSVGYYLSTFQGIYSGDELVAMRGTVQDITERKQIELAHRRNEEDLRVTLDSIGDAVIATDTEGRVTRMNPMAERLTGWPVADALERPLPEVFRIVHAETREPAENPVEKVLETNLVVGLANHTVLIGRDGTEFQIADSGAPIRSSGGETIGVVLVFRDVTQEYALEERLRRSETMQAIGRLAGGVAHDFNNLLTAIMGSAELLAPHLANEDALRHHAIILRGAERAAELTAKLLTFARTQPSSRGAFDVHGTLEEALGILSHVNRHMTVNTKFHGEGSALIEGDRTQVLNAFLNLGINAGQAMPQGGELVVSTRPVVLGSEDLSGDHRDLPPGPYIAVAFRDTGQGIPPDVVDRIFEPFFTTKAPGEGTGLGLAAVWGTVQECRGVVRVESQVGVGTEVTLMLPLTDAPLGEAPQPSAVVRGRGVVLVVDDDPLVRGIAESSLRELGYEVLVADGGTRAVSLFEQQHARVDLVLLDMIMPDMDGRTCFAALQAIDPAVKVVLCTGYANDSDVAVLRAAGLVDVLRKPYRAAALSRAVHEALTAR